MDQMSSAPARAQAGEPETALDEAIRRVGNMSIMARALGLTPKAVRKWKLAKRLPRTEYTGETDYASCIERLTQGAVTRQQLLAMRQKSHREGGGGA